ncbi:IS5 family transposase [Bradyrhizobium stylosanthis]|uniref:IS5 family transposase n=1 Tax=Bradyrhizobium stylosanthis TaxID=1803665 RepID=UPI000A79891D|nr:IS5 family transposase [Bradyrhizobium stylosanthis]
MAIDQPRTPDARAQGDRPGGFADGWRDRQPIGQDHGRWRPSRLRRGKEDQGSKRHIVTDTQGLLVGAIVHAADVQDRDGAPDVLCSIRYRFPWLRHIFADGGYAGEKLKAVLEKIGRWTVEIIKRSDAAQGFEVLTRRWVVERTFAWLGRNRRLAKDFERTIESATAWLFLASVQLMTRRIAAIKTAMQF